MIQPSKLKKETEELINVAYKNSEPTFGKRKQQQKIPTDAKTLGDFSSQMSKILLAKLLASVLRTHTQSCSLNAQIYFKQ